MLLPNLKIGARLGLGFALVLAMLAAVIGLGLASMAGIDARMKQIVDNNNVKIHAAGAMGDSFRDVLVTVASIALAADPAAAKDRLDRLAAIRAHYGAEKERLLATQPSANERQLLARLDAAIEQSKPKINKAVQLSLAGERDQANAAMLKESIPSALAAIAVIDELVALEKQQARQAADDAGARYHDAYVQLLAIGAFSIVAGVAIAWAITRSITVPLRSAVLLAETVAAGDLSTAIAVDQRDETGLLMTALKHMNDSLGNIVGQVRAGTATRPARPCRRSSSASAASPTSWARSPAPARSRRPASSR
jgi:methyl-accepting chemotaxis protein